MSADYKIATGPFLFCLDKAAVLDDFSHSAFILDRTASVWRNEAYRCCCFVFSSCFLFLFCFSRPPGPNRPLQTKNLLKQLRKPSKPPANIVNEAKIATKVSLITVCKGESPVGYRSIVLPKSALRKVTVVARKVDLFIKRQWRIHLLKETNGTKLAGTL